MVYFHISTKGNLKIYHFMTSTWVQTSLLCAQFLNIEDGSKIILLMKSHHNQFFPNGQFFVFLKKNPISYKLKCESTNLHEIFHFSSSPTSRIFLCFSFLGTFFVKVYTLNIFFTFWKIAFLILNYSQKKSTMPKRYKKWSIFLAMTQIHFPTKMNLKKHYFMSFTFMQIGLFCTCSSKHWKWFQDHSFGEISSPSILLKLPIFRVLKKKFPILYK